MSGPSVSTTLPAPTPQELELQNLNLASAKKQSVGQVLQYAQASPQNALAYLDSVKAGTPDPGFQSLFGGLEQFDTPEFRQQLQTAADTQTQQAQLQNLTTKTAMRYATGDLTLSPTEQATLDTAFAGPMAQAQYDLQNYGQDLAASRGLNLSDSPVANELLRQKQLMGTQFGSAKASSALNLGLAQENANLAYNQFTSGLTPGPFAQFANAQGYLSPNLQSGLQFASYLRTQQPTTQRSYGFLDYLNPASNVAQGVGTAVSSFME